MQVEKVQADHALVRVEKRDFTTSSGVLVARDVDKKFDAGDAWEFAWVLQLGDGDWEPVEVGDRVIIQAALGGRAGTDVARALGQGSVIISRDEIVCRAAE